ncbi:hypothetical protein Neosp_011883 [[Neocosmospora] mangrovei]
MAEAAGLALGGIPIAIWALEKYAEPFDAHQNYWIAIQTLRADLTMQKSQLMITLHNIGLENPSMDELQECLCAKFPSIYQDLVIIIKAMDERASKLLGDLDIDFNGKPRWTDDSPDSARWEWRRVKRSFASKKNRSLIDDLRKWNQDLRIYIERTEVSADDDTRQVQALIRGFNPKRCDSIRSCLQSFHRALGSTLLCDCSSSHQAIIQLDWNSVPMPNPLVFSLALSHQTHLESEQSWLTFRVTPKMYYLVDPMAITARPFMGNANSSSPSSLLGMIRLRPLRTHSTTPRPVQDTTPGRSPAKSIANLGGQVQTQRILWSTPADDDRKLWQFSLDQHSEELSRFARTISLRNLILIQNRPLARPHLALSIKQRYAIATSIAWSVLHLSDSPWLREGLDQDSIQFFIEVGSKGMQLASHVPFYSYVCHKPATMDQSISSTTRSFGLLVPNKTIFTLGVTLMELCLGAPIEELRQTLHDESRGQALSSPILYQYDTAIARLDDVYREAGDSYGNAVQRCIKSAFQGPESRRQFNVEQFQIQFYNTVVAPLQATYSMMP